MADFLKRRSSVVLMTLLLSMLALAWVFPSAGLRLGIGFLLISVSLASWLVLEKHREAFRKCEIRRRVFIRNAVVEISGTWIVMGMAGVLGRMAAGIATQPLAEGLVRVLAGIGVGLAVGLVVGMLAKKTLRRLMEIRPSQ